MESLVRLYYKLDYDYTDIQRIEIANLLSDMANIIIKNYDRAEMHGVSGNSNYVNVYISIFGDNNHDVIIDEDAIKSHQFYKKYGKNIKAKFYLVENVFEGELKI